VIATAEELDAIDEEAKKRKAGQKQLGIIIRQQLKNDSVYCTFSRKP
jgi:hypothetical protein